MRFGLAFLAAAGFVLSMMMIVVVVVVVVVFVFSFLYYLLGALNSSISSQRTYSKIEVNQYS